MLATGLLLPAGFVLRRGTGFPPLGFRRARLKTPGGSRRRGVFARAVAMVRAGSRAV
jgi:hypothetical protein